MGKFKDWAKDNIDRGALLAAKTPDLIHGLWMAFEAANHPMFAAYRRSVARHAASAADIDPAARVAKANLTANALLGTTLLMQELDAFSTHVYCQSQAQANRESAELRAHRIPAQGTPDDNGDLPTVRLQVQLNYKQKVERTLSPPR